MNVLIKFFLAATLIPLLTGCFTFTPYGGNPGGGYPSPNPAPRQTPQPQPRPQKPLDRGVKIRNIALTDQYTIITMYYENNNVTQRDQNGRVIYSGNEDIGFDAEANLVALNGARRFRFIKAENIPVKPREKMQQTRPGDRVEFRVYFERLDRGIENFDLFECHDGETFVCWNFYNLRVANPAPSAPQPPINQPNTPAPVAKGVILKGIVRDAKTQKPLTAKLVFAQSPGVVQMDSVQSFQESGLYRIRLTAGQVYTFTSAARGYLVANETIDASKIADGQTITRDIFLKPFGVGDKITLKNIYFEMSKAELLPASYAELDNLVKLMGENPNMQIRLEGHTDIVGDPEANLELSRQRVAAVRAYLSGHGIQANRVEATGYGSKFPILKKGTDEERRVNRRVEFVILKT